VPPDDPASNFGMVWAAWFGPRGLDPARILRIPGELGAAAAAAAADRALGPGRPALALLGLGADGHTASLFPGDPAVARVDARFVSARGGARISASLPLLASCRRVIVLATGAAKADAARALRAGDPASVAARVAAAARTDGARVELWLDRAAADGGVAPVDPGA
jgi:6-phosphogluconolactonase